MASYLNIDPNKSVITSDLDRLKQRILRGVQRALLTMPYNQERGTRNYEQVDNDVQVAISNTIYYTRRYIEKYYPEVIAKTIEVKSLEPLSIEFNLDILEDTTE